MNRVHFPSISTHAWEHPADRATLDSLRKIPGFDVVLRKILGVLSERPLRLITQGSSVEVTASQYPKLNRIYEDVLATFDAPDRYQLFVTQNPVMNAGAVGLDDPFIVLNSGVVLGMDDAQVRSIIGHELGHIMSGHVLYKTMLRFLLQGGQLALRVPLAGLPLLAILGALLEWDRKSELSGDRAGLLACQDPDVVRGALLRLAGGVGEGASVKAFREQAQRYHEDGTVVDSVMKTLALLNRTHPFPVQRIRELDLWIESGEYQSILDGNYPRREDDAQSSTREAWRETVNTYADGFKASADPLAEWVKATGGDVRKSASEAWDWLKRQTADAEDEPTTRPDEIVEE